MKTVVNIEGMTCEHCVAAVKGIIMDIEGIKSVEVSLDLANAIIEYDNLNIIDIVEEINDSQYKASLIE